MPLIARGNLKTKGKEVMTGESTFLRAHQIREGLKQGIKFVADVSEDNKKKLFNIFDKFDLMLKTSQKFFLTNDIPFPEDGKKVDIIPEACNLPADVCYFEREHPIHKIATGVLAFKVPNDVREKSFGVESLDVKFVCAIFFKYQNSSTWNLSPFLSLAGLSLIDNSVKVSNSAMIECGVRSDIRSSLEGAVMAGASEVLFFLQLLSCSNVKMRTIKEPKQLNRKRSAKKLALIDEYHVLQLPVSGNPRYEGKEHSDRNSPRLHFRRGHIRRLSEDQITWVSHCMVGNAELGIVTKEYRL